MTNSWNNSQDFSDDAIRRFLFGRLTPAEQTTFEECLLTDDAFEAGLHLAEIELADDYALARLSASERRAFEDQFLLTVDRKQILNVSTALRDRFASNSIAPAAVEKTSISERLRLRFGLARRWRFAFASAIVVVLLGAAWLVVRRPRITEGIKATIFNRHAPMPSPSTPRMAAHPNNTSAPLEHQTTPSPMPPHEPTASPTIVTVDLLPGLTLDEELPRIDLPKGEHDLVRLQFTLEPNRTGTYQAELLTIDGRSVFVSQSLPSNGADLAIDVPAALLTAGDYQARIERVVGGSTGSVASYYFRVR